MDVKAIKKILRKHFKEIRKKISMKRREEAREKAFLFLKKNAKKYLNVLSFANKKEEIDIWEFNFFLERDFRLFLPLIENEKLLIFKVSDIEKDLILNEKFKILEPKAKKCERAKEKMDLILVPGLAFDEKNHRLGFGKGYYDKLLLEHPSSYFLGVGYKEQFSKKELPIESHDIPLDEIALF
jgi:5-formyltetrahydrofolate cyclo-ligase